MKASMVRIASREGRVVADPEGRSFGRGGYLHHRKGCMEKFVASKVKQFRSLKVRLDRSERIRICEEIEQLLDRAAEVE